MKLELNKKPIRKLEVVKEMEKISGAMERRYAAATLNQCEPRGDGCQTKPAMRA